MRIIPARAGFTQSGGPNGCSGGDHPRSRGVYGSSPAKEKLNTGSSPLARGLPELRARRRKRRRIIPARAGFTGQARGAAGQAPDHPRSRGVYRRGGAPGVGSRGSSPLARGLPLGDSPSRPPSRIIPARAGFTIRVRRPNRAGRDHPRSRGVYLNLENRDESTSGSSPLARGLLDGGDVVVCLSRIIPARAGFT